MYLNNYHYIQSNCTWALQCKYDLSCQYNIINYCFECREWCTIFKRNIRIIALFHDSPCSSNQITVFNMIMTSCHERVNSHFSPIRYLATEIFKPVNKLKREPMCKYFNAVNKLKPESMWNYFSYFAPYFFSLVELQEYLLKSWAKHVEAISGLCQMHITELFTQIVNVLNR